MKTILTIVFSLFLFSVLSAEAPIELPFFDDFSNDYENWTSYSISGDEQWHLSGDDGIDGSKCARFYITTNPAQANNDWLVSKVFNTEDVSNIAIEFKYWFHGNGMKPEFYYTTSFSGDVSATDWIELDNSFWKNEWTWNSARIEIERPGNTFVFAIRYQSTTENSQYVLIDNFSIKEFEPVVCEKVGTTEHFEFYTTLEDGEPYWSEISEKVDEWYVELCSYWDRPGITPLFDPDNKTAIYLFDDQNFDDQSGEVLPEWKCGSIQNTNSIITKLPAGEKSLYENSYTNLVKNTIGQFILTKKFGNGVDNYFKEAFGLFYTGYQPQRDSILKAISIVGDTPSVDVLQDLTNLSTTYKKDLITSFVESKVLSVGGVQNFLSGGMTEHWYSHLEYYYKKPDNERLKLLKQTERFNIYATDSEIPYLNDIGNKLEERISLYETLFDFPIKHRLYCVIYPTAQARTDCLIISGGYGGSGWSGDKLDIAEANLSTSNTGVYNFLIPHELFHVFHFNIVEHLFTIPSLYSEGLANYICFYQDENYFDGSEGHKYKSKIEFAFYHYKTNYKIEPKFEHILDSQPDEEYGGYYNCPYYFGELFYYYFFDKVGGDFSDLRTFFLNGLDYNKIGKNYEEIGNGFISFIKEYAHLIPSDDFINLPFEESFKDFSNGWSKPSYINPDNWQIDDGRENGNNCARFYTNSDKNEPIESWLVSPAFDASNAEEVSLSFDFARFGEGIEVDVFYTDKFEGYTDSTDWTSVMSIEMPTDWNWSNAGEIAINNPSDTVFIGLRMKSTGEQHQQLYIDNFEVDGIVTNSSLISVKKNNLNIHPNPATSKSLISFQTKTSGIVNLSVFDIHGRKITTILHKNLPPGSYNYSLKKNIPSDGIYFLRIETLEGIATQKFVFKNE